MVVPAHTLSTESSLVGPPLALEAYETRDRKVGLVIVDEVNGFATVGDGALVLQAPNTRT